MLTYVYSNWGNSGQEVTPEPRSRPIGSRRSKLCAAWSRSQSDALALIASLAGGLSVELNSDRMIALPAGRYTPFLRVKALNASNADASSARRVDAFRFDEEPVTNAEFLDFVTAHPQWRKSRIKAAVRRRPLSETLAFRLRTRRRRVARRAGHQRLVVRCGGLLQSAGLAPADD